MDLSMDSVTPFSPEWGEVNEWNAAYEKLGNYLRAHGVQSHLHRAHLISRILQRVHVRGAAQLERNPIPTLAIEETNLMLNEWFSAITNQPMDEDLYQAKIDGRVALYLCDSSSRWPYTFLEKDRIPPEMAAAMQEGLSNTGPELQVSSMVPRPIDLGLIPTMADDAMGVLHRAPVIKTVVSLVFFLLILIYLFWTTR